MKEEDQKRLSEWLGDEPGAHLERDARKIWSATASYKKYRQPDTDAAWRSFSGKLEKERAPVSTLIPRRRLAFAATFLLLVFAGALWWNSGDGRDSPQVASTGEGEKKTVVLADDSRVILNENSRLVYPGTWSDASSRTVQLSGEAYFEVTPDAVRPFEIQTQKAIVQVLGTAFNLRAYPEEPFTEVAVVEGVVALSARENAQKLTLKKEEVGRLEHQNGALNSLPRSALNAQSWRTDQLSFHNAPLVEYKEALERHFDIDIRFEDVAVAASHCPYTADWSNEKLEDIFTILELSFGLEIRQNGRRSYIFSGGTCPTAN